jgi:hypothetical protein
VRVGFALSLLPLASTATPAGAQLIAAWCVEHFGAGAGTRIDQPEADLPGVNVIAPDPQPLAPTRVRGFDPIGFEVRNPCPRPASRLHSSPIPGGRTSS